MRRGGTAPATPVAALAREAMGRGLEALASPGDEAAALRWLERAHRLVPHDPNAALTLASACLTSDPARAARLFRRIADEHDVRQAWLGLAAAQFRLGGPEAAEASLQQVLSRFAFMPDTVVLANTVGCRAGSAGWCALRSDGTLEIHPNPAARSGRLRIVLDGKLLRGTALPAGWEGHRSIDVQVDGAPLLGSPIRIAAIRRLAGCVEVCEGGIRGWAWYRGDPDTPPVLTLRDRSRRILRHFRIEDGSAIADTGPLAQPRAFLLAGADLPQAQGVVHLTGPDGRDLPGSPLDPRADEAAHVAAAQALARLYPADPVTRARPTLAGGPALRADAPMPVPPVGADSRKRPLTIVIPVHNGGEVAADCLASVVASAPPECRILVVDDGSSDGDVLTVLADRARRKQITLLRHPVALGFPAAANAGIRAARGRDVVLLNSDTLVPPGWIERLRKAAYASRDIGTVTPFTNDGSILSYPDPAGGNAQPDQAATARLDRTAARANGDAIVDIPVGVGFCLYIRRDCINAVGLLRADMFAQGYGEENDFCLRARRLGWRHVALTGLFVCHRGGTSFGDDALHLRARNGRLLEAMHPGYQALISTYLERDPLAEARRRIDLHRWRARARPGWRSAILITHDGGGGVEQRLQQAAAQHHAAGRRPIVLRPAETASGEMAVAVHDGIAGDLPNLVFAMPREQPALLRLLRATRPERIEAHHLADHPPAIYDLVAQLDVPYDVHVHDYAWFCPRISLLGTHDRYCGEPDLHDCEACVADNGHFLKEVISVSALRERSAGFLAAAQRVVVPSDDTGRRMRRHFEGLATDTVPHENDGLADGEDPGDGVAPSQGKVAAETAGTAAVANASNAIAGNRGIVVAPVPSLPAISRAVAAPAIHRTRTGRQRRTVCVVGAIGVHKGYDVVLACARDAARRDLDLEFVIVGHTIDDARMLATGRVFVTGRFEPDEAVALIAAQNAGLGFVASICPETWCLSLGDIWRAGLHAAAFDIGAPAERIRRTGRGFLLPLGLSASAINNTLITAMRTVAD